MLCSPPQMAAHEKPFSGMDLEMLYTDVIYGGARPKIPKQVPPRLARVPLVASLVASHTFFYLLIPSPTNYLATFTSDATRCPIDGLVDLWLIGCPTRAIGCHTSDKGLNAAFCPRLAVAGIHERAAQGLLASRPRLPSRLQRGAASDSAHDCRGCCRLIQCVWSVTAAGAAAREGSRR